MKGLVAGSDAEAAIKRVGLYIPDALAEALLDKLGVLDAENNRSDLILRYRPCPIIGRTAHGPNGYVYSATFSMPDKWVKTDETYKKYVDRLEKAKAQGILTNTVLKPMKTGTPPWGGPEDRITFEAPTLDELMKAVFDVNINPMIEQLNAEKGTNYSKVDYKAIVRNDEAGLYNPHPTNHGVHSGTVENRVEADKGEGPSK